ncbi:MAG: ABC transporter ATP-binding protein [Cyanobacteriota bacterium]|nr:ABC transporter ATP-binding protein [Cyanobacteriota bacterium]
MIEVEHLSKNYGPQTALDDVTFSAKPGEILGLLGPNGAGKTTTMRILSGYLPATAGTAKVAGYDVRDESMAVRRSIGYLPENPPLYLEMTVEGYLNFVARIKGIPAGDRAQRVDSAIARCSLLEKRSVLIRKLSKGFRQRVGIAQAIVHNPPAIVLDEPTIGLDPRQIIEVRHLIKSLAGEHTILLSTHILPEASMTCDRVTIINKGKVIATNTPENLTAQLSESGGYDLEVEGDIERVRPLLQAIPGVQQVQIIPQETPADTFPFRTPIRSRAYISSTTGAEPGRAIAAAIVTSGLGLYEMRRTRPTLEDVFLELTTRENLDGDRKPSDVEETGAIAKDEDEIAQPEAEPRETHPSLPNLGDRERGDLDAGETVEN